LRRLFAGNRVKESLLEWMISTLQLVLTTPADDWNLPLNLPPAAPHPLF
jgi:hypothetical protein